MCKYINQLPYLQRSNTLADRTASHDCPCHGEYEELNGELDTDGKITGVKDDSNLEDADSESDNGMTHNLRKRVVAEPHMLRDHGFQRESVAYNDNDVGSVQEFLGMSDDGTLSGIWNCTGDRGNPGFPDTESCSADCFWKVWIEWPSAYSSELTCVCRSPIVLSRDQSGLRYSSSFCKRYFLHTLRAAAVRV